MLLFVMYASCKPDSPRPTKGFGLPDPSFSLLFMLFSGLISFNHPANLFDSYPNLFSPAYLHQLNLLKPHLSQLASPHGPIDRATRQMHSNSRVESRCCIPQPPYACFAYVPRTARPRAPIKIDKTPSCMSRPSALHRPPAREALGSAPPCVAQPSTANRG
jgi:hypothetical protein